MDSEINKAIEQEERQYQEWLSKVDNESSPKTSRSTRSVSSQNSNSKNRHRNGKIETSPLVKKEGKESPIDIPTNYHNCNLNKISVKEKTKTKNSTRKLYSEVTA